MKDYKTLSIIIPVFNEEKPIGGLLSNLKGVLNAYKVDYEIIVVNDSSTDRTREVIISEVENNGGIILVDNKGKRGLGRCLKKGFEYVKGDIITILMGDLSDDSNDIPQMLNKIVMEGYDFVCASRYMRGGWVKQGNILKGFFSRSLCRFMHVFLKFPTMDATNAFKMFRDKVLKRISPIKSNRYTLGFELLIKAYNKGFKITEIPTAWQGRTEGQSHFKFLRDGFDYFMWFIFALFSRVMGKRL